MEIRKNLSAIIRIRMKESGKSLTEFSEELEISRSTLQDYLAGKGNPNVATIEHLAKKLNVDASLLVSGAISEDQFEILLPMLNTLELLSRLSPDKRRQFAKLLLDMIALWDVDDSQE